MQQEASRAAPDAIEQSVQSVIDTDLRPRLRNLGLPLLVVHGENDTVVAPSESSILTELGKSVRVVSMPEARHFPMLDRSSQFNRLLADFLDAEDDLSELELKDEWQRRVR